MNEKQKWKQMQVILKDSSKFVDMLHELDWENGLEQNILANTEYYLPKNRDGGEGVTGEGSLLDVPGKL